MSVEGSSTEHTRTLYNPTTTAIILLRANKKRTEYKVVAWEGNNYRIYIGKNSRVSATNYYEVIPPGHTLVDSGDQLTIYRGEVWAIAAGIDQAVWVEEMIKK